MTVMSITMVVTFYERAPSQWIIIGLLLLLSRNFIYSVYIEATKPPK